MGLLSGHVILEEHEASKIRVEEVTALHQIPPSQHLFHLCGVSISSYTDMLAEWYKGLPRSKRVVPNNNGA